MERKLSARTIYDLKPSSKPYEVVDTELKGFLLRVQPSGVMNYYLSYRTTTGKRKRYRIGRYGSITPQQARDIAEKLSARVISGEDVQSLKQSEKRMIEITRLQTLEGFIDNKYAPWVKADRKTWQKTLRMLKLNFGSFLNLPMEEIKPWLVEQWRVCQLETGKNPATINRDVTRLKAALSKAVEWEILNNHPLAQLKPLKTNNSTIIRYLSKEEELQLRTALKEREERIKKRRENGNQWRLQRGYKTLREFSSCCFVDYLQPMILLAINTGMRRGEIFQLTWSNVNFERCILTIAAVTAKNGRERHIPLNQEILIVLKTWRKQMKGKNLVFPGKDGESFDNIYKSWKNLLREANIVNFRWHDLRHHFASKLVMSGVDLNTVRELLGHSDLTMTLRYAHLAPEHKARAVAKLLKEAELVA